MKRLLKLTLRLHDDRAQDLLSFVLIMPFILFLVFVIADFGIALDRSLVIKHAAREAARYGAVGQDEASIRQRAIDQSQNVLDTATAACPLAAADDACLEVTWGDGPDGNVTVGDTGDGVAVRVRYRYKLINPFLAWLPFNEILLGACADSRLEVPPATATDKSWDCT